MFSYTAAFSVAAAMGGAVETTSVDLAKRSRELSTAHFEANGFSMDNHRLVVMDVFDYFKYAKKKAYLMTLSSSIRQALPEIRNALSQQIRITTS